MKVTLDIPEDFDESGFFDIIISLGTEKWTARSAMESYMLDEYRGDIRQLKHDYKFRALYEAMQVIQKRIDKDAH